MRSKFIKFYSIKNREFKKSEENNMIPAPEISAWIRKSSDNFRNILLSNIGEKKMFYPKDTEIPLNSHKPQVFPINY